MNKVDWRKLDWKKADWKKLGISIAVSLGAGLLSWLLTGSMKQYGLMNKPPLSPPAWLFPVVWTILFILMGIAAYLVYVTKGNGHLKKQALQIYLAQLGVNIFWPVIFFRFHAEWLAFFWLLLLWLLIYETIHRFHRINMLAAKLLLPYLAWVTFAGYLNFVIALK